MVDTSLWESFAYCPTILTSWLYYFLTNYLNGNELTCKAVSFDPLITQKCNGTQTGSLINQKFISAIRLEHKPKIKGHSQNKEVGFLG